ncbi:MAG: hypothetical protein AABX66_02475 [Nanoarchaeota archaeon]
MKIQKTISAPASFYRVSSISPLAKLLIKAKVLALARGILIQDELIASIESFVERNNVIEPKGTSHTSCPHCLKAHTIKKAKELELDRESVRFLSNLIKGNLGHDGYYLDGDELIKIN